MALVLFLIVASASAEIVLFGGTGPKKGLAIRADACLWAKWSYLSETDYMGMRPVNRIEHGFSRVTSYAGLTLQYSDLLAGRVFCDLGDITGKPCLDLYGSAMYQGLEFRLGLFRPPAGGEILVQPDKLDFIDYALSSQQRTPTGMMRDIGIQTIYTHARFWGALALVNGAGRTRIADNNRYKDLVFRLAALPLSNGALTLGGGLYLGADTLATDEHFQAFRRFSVGGNWTRPGYFVKAEFLTGADAQGGMNSICAAAGFRIWGRDPIAGQSVSCPRIQSVVRFERLVPLRPNLPILVLTLGMNGFFVQDRVKPMLDFTWLNDKVTEKESFKLAFQLQLSF